mmetsp:Transcript_25411/g.61448  ORF Transcript_25411/g.61448 Transcript_25411/m.61448 type:complete len:202 (+) Transcript_25411:350-955(+)
MAIARRLWKPGPLRKLVENNRARGVDVERGGRARVLWDVHKVVADFELRRKQPRALIAHHEGRRPRATERMLLHWLRARRDLDAADDCVAHVVEIAHGVVELDEVREAQVAAAAVRAVRGELGGSDDDDLADAHRRGGAQQLSEVLPLGDVVQHEDGLLADDVSAGGGGGGVCHDGSAGARDLARRRVRRRREEGRGERLR